MANMTISDRNQMERATLSYGTGVRIGGLGRRMLAAYSVVATVVLGALLVGAMQVFDGWHHVVVIGVGLVTFYGLCRWVWPERKHA
jgi:hypothetical protein